MSQGLPLVRVRGPRDPRRPGEINTCSHANNWQRGLSPFVLGPIDLYNGFVGQNLENSWQYSKVYHEQADADGNPTAKYWAWAIPGWNNPRAVRYPMGKGRKPLYSLWDGERLGYVDARKRIYLPLYAAEVVKGDSFAKLRAIATEQGEVTLFDFDGYDHHALGMSLDDVLNDPKRKMGHAFVLAMLLTNHPVVTPLLQEPSHG